MLHLNWYPFSELTAQQLYGILALRADVFIVEQHCPYLDPDGKDLFAMHLLGMEYGSLAAYLRLFPPTEIENYITFGRVVTARSARTKGYGKKLIHELLIYCDKNYPDIPIQCSAQNYLQKFYERFGFKAYGESYDEDGIPHIAMKRS
ncbi:acetyltransferase [Legionella norrlandica]|uniref:Acetyltransferase n=1 Tax=Legionella norrlandica TaxID=1498499 RepID=A0A0A2SUT1_9GAMM|nr:GNAT family N-acetyltransferase [Legionella norrlandica]KGP63209.1 acetyltransferase [Legionella norrlandica]